LSDIFTFAGGIHPPYAKKATRHLPINKFPTPQKVVVPVLMHIGAPAKAIVKVGDKVAKGQCVAEADGFVSSPAFASISGVVSAVGPFAHACGKAVTAVEITADGKNDEVRFDPMKNWKEQPSRFLIKRISDCGIVGMGGAGFPTHVKLLPPQDKKIDTLIINAAECEPYLTTDHRLMLEQTDKILLGTKILQKILDVWDIYIVIEKNKPDAIDLFKRKTAMHKELSGINIVAVETKYPQGGEKQLVSAVVDREIPSGKLTMDSGCVVQNVSSAAAICDAVFYGIPLSERIITVAGNLVTRPGNYLVPIGTSIREVLEYCGANLSMAKKVVMGGPMMGVSLPDIDVPVIKQTSGLLVFNNLTPAEGENNCINCGRCADVCPIRLIPSFLAKYSARNMYEEAQKRNAMDCIECGCCSYVCPAKINILHRIRTCKNYLTRQKAAKTSTQDK